MSERPTYEALLLRVMAHDLLAPLTAIKWQTELLEHPKSEEKREVYLKGLGVSTRLGIALCKHAHVAGMLLSGAYEGDHVEVPLGETLENVLADLRLQYERHGLALDLALAYEDGPRSVDAELLGLFAWSIAKFFLTCVPAPATVSVTGTPSKEAGAYVLTYRVPMVVGEDWVGAFSRTEASGVLDMQTLFAHLVHHIAPHAGATVRGYESGGLFCVEATFSSV